jgi:choline-phosphate cytidylyltransferase
VRVYADGVFDMYHIGHAKVLEQAKKLFTYVHLIVGVSPDKDVLEKKGKLVMNEKDRSEILKHCKWVDEVVMPCPWVITMDFLNSHNIHYVAHDDAPYNAGADNPEDDIYYEVKKAGMFKATQRTKGISTSDIIRRIIKDYDEYVLRSLERGMSRKDVGVSRTKLWRIQGKSYFKNFVKKVYENDIGQEIRDRIRDINSGLKGKKRPFKFYDEQTS